MSAEPPKKPPLKFIPPRPKPPEATEPTPPESTPVPPPPPIPTSTEAQPTNSEAVGRPVEGHPLHKFTLLGRGSALASTAAEARPVIGHFNLGEMSMLYAAGNTGKSLILTWLILKAIADGRIKAEDVWVIDADNSSHGLAGKVKLLDEVGAHMLAPGHRGFRMVDLPKLILEITNRGYAPGTCIIIDTLKKVVDLMNKKAQSDFNDILRGFIMAGGTVIAVGHTRKHPAADGTPVPQGTNDVLEDFDAVYVAVAQPSKADPQDRVVVFTKRKSRAPSPETVAYAYSMEEGLSYDAKLASVRPIPIDQLDDYATDRTRDDEVALINAICRLIEEGENEGKMKLARAAAERCGASPRAAVAVLERYTETFPEGPHYWTVRTGHRGVQIYGFAPPPA